MGCVSSNLLSNEESFSQLGGSALGVGHHIVSLTSTTYGLLNLDPPSTTTTPPTPPSRFTLGSVFPVSLSDSSSPKTSNLVDLVAGGGDGGGNRSSLWSQPSPFRSDRPQEVINSWELMSGLDPVDSFRFSPLPARKDQTTPSSFHKENSNPNFSKPPPPPPQQKPQPLEESPNSGLLGRFEELCPPNGADRVVIYTTSLRGIRKTFEACSVVRAAIESFGIQICERDVSMDRGFKDELKDLMVRSGDCRKGEDSAAAAAAATTLPRVFVKGRYVGGVEEVMKIVEEGSMGDLLQGLPRSKASGGGCEGCGNARFLPCFSCNGSCKMVMAVKEKETDGAARSVVVRCPDCNENGLVLCPICS